MELFHPFQVRPIVLDACMVPVEDVGWAWGGVILEIGMQDVQEREDNPRSGATSAHPRVSK